MPTTAYIFGNPDLVVNETHIFLPPISSKPTLIIAPNLAITYTWDLPIIYSIVFLKSANFGSELVVETWNKIDKATYTPCRTKSTESFIRGQIKSKASLVYLAPIAKAITHPYLI